MQLVMYIMCLDEMNDRRSSMDRQNIEKVIISACLNECHLFVNGLVNIVHIIATGSVYHVYR